MKNAVTAVIGDTQTGRRREPEKNCVIYVCDQRGKEVDAVICQPLDRQTL